MQLWSIAGIGKHEWRKCRSWGEKLELHEDWNMWLQQLWKRNWNGMRAIPKTPERSSIFLHHFDVQGLVDGERERGDVLDMGLTHRTWDTVWQSRALIDKDDLAEHWSICEDKNQPVENLSVTLTFSKHCRIGKPGFPSKFYTTFGRICSTQMFE